MIAVTRLFEFDAAHRVLGHEGKCRHLHGHRYRAEVTVQAPDLDALGRVVDFSVLKERVGVWLDEFLDHNAILHPSDPLLKILRDAGERVPFVMPFDKNPTAENIAFVIYHVAVSLLPDHLEVLRVRVWETSNCYAVFSPGGAGGDNKGSLEEQRP